MNLKARFVDFLIAKYPSLSDFSLQANGSNEQIKFDSLISENLLSEFQISLTLQQIETIRNEIKQYWLLRHWSEAKLNEKYLKLNLRKPTNFAACMSYDFHINSDGMPELIEINTNAAFLSLGLELYQFLSIQEPCANFNEQKFIEMFKNENQLAHNNQNLKLVILDDKPLEQRLFSEFLLVQAQMKKFGIDCKIADIIEKEKIESASLIYNRYTDFYFSLSQSDFLKKLFNENRLQFSPHPYEYFLLADKERLIDWSNQTDLPKPKSLLITYDMAKANKEEVWNERKNLFFKPKNAFGSKQVYKGSSISKKIFDEVTGPDFIAQKASPAPEVEFEFKGQKQKYKYDLRCYAYQDQLQMIIARIYQGQTTNLRTEGGGFACIKVN